MNRHFLHECHERHLLSYPQNGVLKSSLLHELVANSTLDLLLLDIPKLSFFRKLFDQQRLVRQRGVSIAIDGIHRENEELEESIHICLVSDNDIDITVLQLKRQTLPRIPGYTLWVLELLDLHRDHVLPEQPEPSGACAKNNAFNIFYVERSRRQLIFVLVLPSLKRLRSRSDVRSAISLELS